jgi:hypothetical protein
MRDYGKIYVSFWTSGDTAALSTESKLLAAYLLSGPHTNMIGCFRLPPAYIAADLQFSHETVLRGFAELSRIGFATYDEQLEWVVVHRFLRWNRMQNPNQGKAAAKLALQIPAGSIVNPILADAFDEFGEYLPEEFPKQFRNSFEKVPLSVSKPFQKVCETVPKPFREGSNENGETVSEQFRNGSERVCQTVSKQFRNQEQEQEQEQEQDPDIAIKTYQNNQAILINIHSASGDAVGDKVSPDEGHPAIGPDAVDGNAVPVVEVPDEGHPACDSLTEVKPERSSHLCVQDTSPHRDPASKTDPLNSTPVAQPPPYLTRRKRKLSGWKLKAFDEFWETFAFKKGRAEAADAWLDISDFTHELARKIINAAVKEARARPVLISKGQTPKWAQGWLSARRWEDWEDNCSTAHNQNCTANQEANHGTIRSRSREEERAEYLESIREAVKRFM